MASFQHIFGFLLCAFYQFFDQNHNFLAIFRHCRNIWQWLGAVCRPITDHTNSYYRWKHQKTWFPAKSKIVRCSVKKLVNMVFRRKLSANDDQTKLAQFWSFGSIPIFYYFITQKILHVNSPEEHYRHKLVYMVYMFLSNFIKYNYFWALVHLLNGANA